MAMLHPPKRGATLLLPKILNLAPANLTRTDVHLHYGVDLSAGIQLLIQAYSRALQNYES